MKGRTMDLLPPATREQVEKAEAIQRNVVVGLIAAILLVAAWLHGGIRLGEAESNRADARKRAEEVLFAEQESVQLKSKLAEISQEISAYRSVQLPFKISTLLATIANELPESVMCNRIELDSSSIVGAPVRADAGSELVAPPGRLSGEIEGIAANDIDVATLVDSLRSRQPIGEVEVETSRHIQLGERSARAFKIRFTIDLDSLNPSKVTNVAIGGLQ